jgi:uridine phosphorylase
MSESRSNTTDAYADARKLPILDHPLEAPTVFSPEGLVKAVRAQHRMDRSALPEVCVLDFDGDLTDELVRTGEAEPCAHWPCFHTAMFTLQIESSQCGLIARTIGGPYAVLIAEQLAVCGVRAIVGLASAGRLDPTLPLPAIVVASRAIRDEGTSYHYLPPGDSVEALPDMVVALAEELIPLGLITRLGTVWTTDAPYRETAEQCERHRQAGAFAVEMQAASLFAFSVRSGVPIGLVAHLTNAPDHRGHDFDKGPLSSQRQILYALARAGQRVASSGVAQGSGVHSN